MYACTSSKSKTHGEKCAFLNASSTHSDSPCFYVFFLLFVLFIFLHKLLQHASHRVLHGFGKRRSLLHFRQRLPILLRPDVLLLLRIFPDVFEIVVVVVVIITIVAREPHSSNNSRPRVFHRFIFNHHRWSGFRVWNFILGWKLWKQIASRKEKIKFLQLQLLLIRANRAGEFTFVHLCATHVLLFFLYIDYLRSSIVLAVVFLGNCTSRALLDQLDDVCLDGILDG
mmetsp:Transcript_7839/g.24612  ORF Transcript_7839/g.24612 Transcript_7839/m.24612 type:complete len:227 (-) Transcript_7839:5515-6195(-)